MSEVRIHTRKETRSSSTAENPYLDVKVFAARLEPLPLAGKLGIDSSAYTYFRFTGRYMETTVEERSNSPLSGGVTVFSEKVGCTTRRTACSLQYST
jgi:hypothetical protein